MATPGQEKRLKNTVLDKIKSTCSFSASVKRSTTKSGTPDIVCVQKDQYKEYTRLIETDYDGKLEPETIDDLQELAEQTGENTKMEVHYRPSPRKTSGRTIKKDDWDKEKIRRKLSEFQ